MSEQANNGSSRRDFLRTAAVTAATAAVSSSMPTTAEGMRRVIGANDRLIVGHVGVGGQGMAHVRLLKENSQLGLKNNTEQIAVCDLYRRRLKGAQAFLLLKDNQAYSDYRKVLDIKEIDAVWVTTSDQWHADIANAAMLAGKHVYIEKPMAKTVEEAFMLYDTAKKTGKVVQVGSQGCSDQKWHVAGQVIKSGRIGKLVMAQGSYCRNGKDGEWNYYAIDKDAGPTATGDAYVDWETFRKNKGPKEFDPDRYFRWRKWWDYGNGIMGDLFPHRLHPLMIAMNMSQEGYDGFPKRVSSLGGLYVQKINPVTKKPDREVPDFTNITVDFFNDCSLMLLGTVINEEGWQDMIRGNMATLYFGGSGVMVKPERVYVEDVEGGTVPVDGWDEQIYYHEKNFIDAIRTGSKPNANIDLAVRVQVMISLGEMAYRKNKGQGCVMHFDPKTRKYWS
jgi:predicted dehydrogenase